MTEPPVNWTRREWIKTSLNGAAAAACAMAIPGCRPDGLEIVEHPERPIAKDTRPNILFVVSDDLSWRHKSAYGYEQVFTPYFDRIAEEGILFKHAYVTSPSCTPSRGSMLTGQWFWRLGEGANLWSTLDPDIPTYTGLLEEAGYHVGFTGKGWGPGVVNGWEYNPAGKAYNHHRLLPPTRGISDYDYAANFVDFLHDARGGQPFCFWFGPFEPHRHYEPSAALRYGIDPTALELPAFLPDVPEVREDMADYLFEIQWFDEHLGRMMATLEHYGELENTIIVVTSDNGMPFPRAKGTLYDYGTRVPLAIRWGEHVPVGRRVDDFVSLQDLAPTFLDAAGVEIPDVMTGQSLLPLLESESSGQVMADRDAVLTGRERHVPGQPWPSMAGYPSRAIRTHQWLYVRNFEPERWPAGAPEDSTMGIPYPDVDGGPSKSFLLEHRDDPEIQPYYKWAFGKRPAEELYNVETDPYQLTNLADAPELDHIKQHLAQQLLTKLEETGDPRVLERGEQFDAYPYYGQLARPESIPHS